MNRAVEFLRYTIAARNEHGLHSPFLFELYNEVFKSPKHYYCFEELEAQRKVLLSDNSAVRVSDFGAGSSYGSGELRSIKKIAKQSLKSRKYAQLLFRLALHLKAKKILELGTSLGLTTSYFASSDKQSKVFTIEACPNIHRKAQTMFDELGLVNIHAELGQFKDEIPKLGVGFDLIFIDGHHDGEACLNYLEGLKSKLNPKGAVVVVDDIRWSSGMNRAWKSMLEDPFFQVKLDVFELGILIFRPQQASSRHILRY